MYIELDMYRYVCMDNIIRCAMIYIYMFIYIYIICHQ